MKHKIDVDFGQKFLKALIDSEKKNIDISKQQYLHNISIGSIAKLHDISINHISHSFTVMLDGLVSRTYIDPQIQFALGIGALDDAFVVAQAIQILEEEGFKIDMSVDDILKIIYAKSGLSACIDMGSIDAGIRKFICSKEDFAVGIDIPEISIGFFSSALESISIYIDMMADSILVRVRTMVDEADTLMSDIQDIPLLNSFYFEEV